MTQRHRANNRYSNFPTVATGALTKQEGQATNSYPINHFNGTRRINIPSKRDPGTKLGEAAAVWWSSRAACQKTLNVWANGTTLSVCWTVKHTSPPQERSAEGYRGREGRQAENIEMKKNEVKRQIVLMRKILKKAGKKKRLTEVETKMKLQQ